MADNNQILIGVGVNKEKLLKDIAAMGKDLRKALQQTLDNQLGKGLKLTFTFDKGGLKKQIRETIKELKEETDLLRLPISFVSTRSETISPDLEKEANALKSSIAAQFGRARSKIGDVDATLSASDVVSSDERTKIVDKLGRDLDKLDKQFSKLGRREVNRGLSQGLVDSLKELEFQVGQATDKVVSFNAEVVRANAQDRVDVFNYLTKEAKAFAEELVDLKSDLDKLEFSEKDIESLTAGLTSGSAGVNKFVKELQQKLAAGFFLTDEDKKKIRLQFQQLIELSGTLNGIGTDITNAADKRNARTSALKDLGARLGTFLDGLKAERTKLSTLFFDDDVDQLLAEFESGSGKIRKFIVGLRKQIAAGFALTDDDKKKIQLQFQDLLSLEKNFSKVSRATGSLKSKSDFATEFDNVGNSIEAAKKRLDSFQLALRNEGLNRSEAAAAVGRFNSALTTVISAYERLRREEEVDGELNEGQRRRLDLLSKVIRDLTNNISHLTTEQATHNAQLHQAERFAQGFSFQVGILGFSLGIFGGQLRQVSQRFFEFLQRNAQLTEDLERVKISLQGTASTTREAADEFNYLRELANKPGLDLKTVFEGFQIAKEFVPNLKEVSSLLTTLANSSARVGSGPQGFLGSLERIKKIMENGLLEKDDLDTLRKNLGQVDNILLKKFGTSNEALLNKRFNSGVILQGLLQGLSAQQGVPSSTADAFREIANSVNFIALQLNEVLRPAIEDFARLIRENVEPAVNTLKAVFDGLSPSTQEFISKVLVLGPALAGVLGTLATVVGALFGILAAINQSIVVFKNFRAALAVGSVAEGVSGAGLIGALLQLREYLPSLTGLVTKFKAIISPLLAIFRVGVAEGLGNFFAGLVDGFTEVIGLTGPTGVIINLVLAFITNLGNFRTIIVNAFGDLVQSVKNLFSAFTKNENFVKAFKIVVEETLSAIQLLVSVIATTVATAIAVVIDGIAITVQFFADLIDLANSKSFTDFVYRVGIIFYNLLSGILQAFKARFYDFLLGIVEDLKDTTIGRNIFGIDDTTVARFRQVTVSLGESLATARDAQTAALNKQNEALSKQQKLQSGLIKGAKAYLDKLEEQTQKLIRQRDVSIIHAQQTQASGFTTSTVALGNIALEQSRQELSRAGSLAEINGILAKAGQQAAQIKADLQGGLEATINIAAKRTLITNDPGLSTLKEILDKALSIADPDVSQPLYDIFNQLSSAQDLRTIYASLDAFENILKSRTAQYDQSIAAARNAGNANLLKELTDKANILKQAYGEVALIITQIRTGIQTVGEEETTKSLDTQQKLDVDFINLRAAATERIAQLENQINQAIQEGITLNADLLRAEQEHRKGLLETQVALGAITQYQLDRINLIADARQQQYTLEQQITALEQKRRTAEEVDKNQELVAVYAQQIKVLKQVKDVIIVRRREVSLENLAIREGARLTKEYTGALVGFQAAIASAAGAFREKFLPLLAQLFSPSGRLTAEDLRRQRDAYLELVGVIDDPSLAQAFTTLDDAAIQLKRGLDFKTVAADVEKSFTTIRKFLLDKELYQASEDLIKAKKEEGLAITSYFNGLGLELSESLSSLASDERAIVERNLPTDDPYLGRLQKIQALYKEFQNAVTDPNANLRKIFLDLRESISHIFPEANIQKQLDLLIFQTDEARRKWNIQTIDAQKKLDLEIIKQQEIADTLALEQQHDAALASIEQTQQDDSLTIAQKSKKLYELELQAKTSEAKLFDIREAYRILNKLAEAKTQAEREAILAEEVRNRQKALDEFNRQIAALGGQPISGQKILPPVQTPSQNDNVGDVNRRAPQAKTGSPDVFSADVVNSISKNLADATTAIQKYRDTITNLVDIYARGENVQNSFFESLQKHLPAASAASSLFGNILQTVAVAGIQNFFSALGQSLANGESFLGTLKKLFGDMLVTIGTSLLTLAGTAAAYAVIGPLLNPLVHVIPGAAPAASAANLASVAPYIAIATGAGIGLIALGRLLGGGGAASSASTSATNKASSSAGASSSSSATYDPTKDPKYIAQRDLLQQVSIDIRHDDGIIVKKIIKELNRNDRLAQLTGTGRSGGF